VEALGGSLECIYWQMDSEDGMAIADFPDSVSASAVEAAIYKTGAFRSVDGHELLTQQQIRDRLVLAKDASQAYEVPGRPD
jgi:GYD domain